MTPTIIDRPSPNHSPRKPGVRVDTVLIHHTASDFDKPTIEWLCSPTSGVSAHYVVGTKGAVVRLVDEGRKAWHAGKGRLPWETCKEYDFNHRSIGIEVVNPGDGKTPFTEAQYAALCWLVPDIVRRLGWERARVHPGDDFILLGGGVAWRAGYVLGHRDVAPGRKTDPADNFDWGRIRRALGEMA
jgi:N-acetylmuramoyl-L-alanine amidase